MGNIETGTKEEGNDETVTNQAYIELCAGFRYEKMYWFHFRKVWIIS